MSTLFIRDIIAEGKHGHHGHEKDSPQPFKVSVELSIDLAKAASSDDLTDTIDWSGLRDSIVAVVEKESFNLVEKLAQAIGDKLLEEERIEKVIVTVEKLEAFPSGVPGI